MDQTHRQIQNLAGSVIETLQAHRVRRVFGIPGGGSSLAIMEAAGQAGLEFILTRSETAAAIMAAVTGELTGTPGVVLTGIGPGATSAVNGIAYAYLEKSPVILFTDGPAASPHQALDQNALYRPVTKHQACLRPATAQADFQLAVRTALERPSGPVQLDITAGDATTAVSDNEVVPVDTAFRTRDVEEGGEAADLLAHSRKPVIIAGLEARHGEAPAALRQLAEALSCPVLLSYKASGALPANHPGFAGLFTGAIAEADLLHAADLIILFGFDPIEMIPGQWSYQAPVLDLLPAPTTPLPFAPTSRILAPLRDSGSMLLSDARRSDWDVGEIASARQRIRGKLRLVGAGHTTQTIIETTARLAPPGTRLTVDSGAHMFAAMAFWPAEEPFGVLKSNGLSTMGYALPAAIASALQEPERPVIAVTGDGGMMMSLAELATAVEHQCNITVLVVNDAALSLIDIKQQRQQYGSRGVRYPATDLAAAAEAMGCAAWRIGPDEVLEGILEAAFAMPGPKLVDVAADPSGYSDQLERLRG